MTFDEKKLSFVKGIDRFVIPLGFKCNLNCRHCMQHFNVCHRYYGSDSVSEELIETLVEWSNAVPYRNRKVFKRPNIVFYGGEPLLYFDKIKRIVFAFEKKNFDFNKVRLKVFSNCILLDKDMVDFFNYYGIACGLSADGENLGFVRNDFPNSDIVKLWKRIQNRFVISVITSGNSDYINNILFLKNKFETEEIDIELVKVGWDMPRDIYTFSSGNFDKMFLRLLLYYSSHNLDHAFYSFFHNLIPDLIIPDGYVTFSVDANGDIGIRRFCNEKIYNISDDYTDYYRVSSNLIASRIMPCCKQCRFLKECFSAVALKELKFSKVPDYYCAYYKDFMRSFFKYRDKLRNLILSNKV